MQDYEWWSRIVYIYYHRPCYNLTNGAKQFGKCKESWWFER